MHKAAAFFTESLEVSADPLSRIIPWNLTPKPGPTLLFAVIKLLLSLCPPSVFIANYSSFLVSSIFKKIRPYPPRAEKSLPLSCDAVSIHQLVIWAILLACSSYKAGLDPVCFPLNTSRIGVVQAWVSAVFSRTISFIYSGNFPDFSLATQFSACAYSIVKPFLLQQISSGALVITSSQDQSLLILSVLRAFAFVRIMGTLCLTLTTQLFNIILLPY